MKPFSKVISTRNTVEKKADKVDDADILYEEKIYRKRFTWWGLFNHVEDLSYYCTESKQTETKNGIGFKKQKL